jgi:hypothetical protein
VNRVVTSAFPSMSTSLPGTMSSNWVKVLHTPTGSTAIGYRAGGASGSVLAGSFTATIPVPSNTSSCSSGVMLFHERRQRRIAPAAGAGVAPVTATSATYRSRVVSGPTFPSSATVFSITWPP